MIVFTKYSKLSFCSQKRPGVPLRILRPQTSPVLFSQNKRIDCRNKNRDPEHQRVLHLHRLHRVPTPPAPAAPAAAAADASRLQMVRRCSSERTQNAVGSSKKWILFCLYLLRGGVVTMGRFRLVPRGIVRNAQNVHVTQTKAIFWAPRLGTNVRQLT